MFRSNRSRSNSHPTHASETWLSRSPPARPALQTSHSPCVGHSWNSKTRSTGIMGTIRSRLPSSAASMCSTLNASQRPRDDGGPSSQPSSTTRDRPGRSCSTGALLRRARGSQVSDSTDSRGGVDERARERADGGDGRRSSWSSRLSGTRRRVRSRSCRSNQLKVPFRGEAGYGHGFADSGWECGYG